VATSKVNEKTCVWLVVVLLQILPLLTTAEMAISGSEDEAGTSCSYISRTVAETDGAEQPDIQWFKDQMKISPKYLERREGIAGMSWLHFIATGFLLIFFVGALTAFYSWNRRTRRILGSLLQEDEHGRDKS